MRAFTITFVAVLLAAPVAMAQPTNQDADEAARVGDDASGTTIYDFDDDNVDGEILSPDGANIASRGRVKHASLIQIRPHFIPELIKMANDV